MTELLLINLAVVLVYMTLWFAAAKHRKRLDTVDSAWGLGFVVLAWATYIQQTNSVSLLIAILVSIWGIRLFTHISRRSAKRSEDPRYEELSAKWKGNFWLRAYLSIFLLQGALVWIISLPVMLASGEHLSGWAWLSILGLIVWLKGFTIEALADRQLANFLKDKKHPKVLRTGLWRYSRHPNYFGELQQWWGIGVIALQASYGWIGLAGPLTLTILIVFVSGIPPIEKRRVKDPEYREYQRTTSSLIPLPPR